MTSLGRIARNIPDTYGTISLPANNTNSLNHMIAVYAIMSSESTQTLTKD